MRSACFKNRMAVWGNGLSPLFAANGAEKSTDRMPATTTIVRSSAGIMQGYAEFGGLRRLNQILLAALDVCISSGRGLKLLTRRVRSRWLTCGSGNRILELLRRISLCRGLACLSCGLRRKFNNATRRNTKQNNQESKS